MRSRSYRELSRLDSFKERFEYLQCFGEVGKETFGFDRYLNQKFYTSTEWRNVRKHVIARDLGRDLGIEGFEIHSRPVIHHMNPMTVEDLKEFDPRVIDPEYLITTTLDTHNAIHYGDISRLPREPIERKPGDTKLW